MTAESWKLTTLGAIAEEDHGLVDGPFGSNLPASAYMDDGVPVIRGSNLSLGECRFNDKEFVFVSEETARQLSRSLCEPGDIIFTKKGTLGQTGIVPRHARFDRFLLSSNQMKLSVEPTKADRLFIYYLLSSPSSRSKIVQDASITGVPKTNLAYLRDFPILLPPTLREQAAIANVLGTLDDKIELNRGMNEVLEAIARAIFRSWFVDFGPVHAKAEGHDPGLPKDLADIFPDSFEKSELGEIPRGSRIGTVGDLCTRILEKVDNPYHWRNQPLIDLSRMPQKSIALTEWGLGEELTTSVTRFRTKDTLFGAIRPYFHKVGLAPIDGVTNVSVFVLRARYEFDWAFVAILCSMADTIEYATRVARGTKMPVVTWPDLQRHQLVTPSSELREAFSRKVGPLLERMIASIHEARTLVTIRDALLPRLVAGELRIKDVERIIGRQV